MDTHFFENYYKYFLWNDCLIKYFFQESNQEILLYVDDKLLDDIGAEVKKLCDKYIEPNATEDDGEITAMDDDYAADFITTVENFCKYYTEYLNPPAKCPSNQIEQKKCKRWDKLDESKTWGCCKCRECNHKEKCEKNREDILSIANNMIDLSYWKRGTGDTIEKGEQGKPIKQQLPYFAIVIYVIYKFDNGETQKWDNVKAGNSNSGNFINSLWVAMSDYDKRFKNSASVYDESKRTNNDYVGKIKYHQPLSAPTRNKLQDAIYKSGAWNYVDTKGFWDIVCMIQHSIKDGNANEELSKILKKCYLKNDFQGISGRRIQSVIDNFDVREYEKKLEERKNNADYNKTIISGKFALGIRFSSSNTSDQDISIVLLTTVQESIDDECFRIKEGPCYRGGYNNNDVEVKQKTVKLKDYSLCNENYRIESLHNKNDDAIFFYEYDESLFIQTREIIPAKSYIIAVKDDSKCDRKCSFEEWCKQHNNNIALIDKENTKDIFGEEWIIYTTGGLNKEHQYYNRKISSTNETSVPVIVKNGGMKKKGSDIYFINALPYFEIPEDYDINKVEVDVTIQPKSDTFNFNKYITDRKIIIDLQDVLIGSDKVIYINVILKYNEQEYSYDIMACGQTTTYNTDYFYNYDNFGLITEDEDKISFSGNFVNNEICYANINGLFQISNRITQINDVDLSFENIKKGSFADIVNNLYFTNLLAAICYNADNLVISTEKFKRCVRYAATRLEINASKDNFINDAKRVLGYAGILNVNYANNGCQAMAPMFMRVPFSIDLIRDHQLIMLCGCYTRSFISDLYQYCNDKKLGMFYIENKKHREEELLLPPIILLEHTFTPTDFCEKYNHKCDFLEYDFAQSLLNIIPEYSIIKSRFEFKEKSSEFSSSLDKHSTEYLPRIRTKTGRYRKDRYIEDKDGKGKFKFSDIPDGMTTWASLYCHYEIGIYMVILDNDSKSVLIPKSLLLPNYIQRALYLMNMGLPEQKRVFICGNKGDDYYSVMNKYELHNKERCQVFASKISGEKCKLVREKIQNRSDFKMEFWTSKNKFKPEKYLVLKYHEKMLAIANGNDIYYNKKGQLKKIKANSDSRNDIMSYLITENWKCDNNSIGKSYNGGVYFEEKYRLEEKTINIPNKDNFNVIDIEIV